MGEPGFPHGYQVVRGVSADYACPRIDPLFELRRGKPVGEEILWRLRRSARGRMFLLRRAEPSRQEVLR